MCTYLNIDITVETRTGDDTAYKKLRQYRQPPEILITTPESLSLFLSREQSRSSLNEINLIIVDEWHELYHSKRGTQIELLMANLRGYSPNLKTIGISATLANSKIAQRLFPNSASYKLIKATPRAGAIIDIIAPEKFDRFPWAGHMGLTIFDQVLPALNQKSPFLLFTNTRFQAESWYERIISSGTFEKNKIGLHHGSLSAEERHRVENEIKMGELKGVVCTSSLDLGIDLPTIRQVFQVGNPKSVARLLQRAGRAEHSPRKTPKVTLIPTNSWELFEFLALMKSENLINNLESLPLPAIPYDVLSQHLVTLACVGFEGEKTFREVCSTAAFKDLDQKTWNEILSFLTLGGDSLGHYPDFKKLVNLSGFYQVCSEHIAQIHRLSIGTISSSDQVEVKLRGQKTLGFIDSYFADHLEKGEQFTFSGKVLEVIIKRPDQLIVKLGRGHPKKTSVWGGSTLPLSESVSEIIKQEFKKMAAIFFEEKNRSRIENRINQISAGDVPSQMDPPRSGVTHNLENSTGQIILENLKTQTSLEITSKPAFEYFIDSISTLTTDSKDTTCSDENAKLHERQNLNRKKSNGVKNKNTNSISKNFKTTTCQTISEKLNPALGKHFKYSSKNLLFNDENFMDSKNEKVLNQVFELLRTQSSISEVPSFQDTMIEIFKSNDAEHAYVYTLEGLRVNEALGNIAIFALQKLKEGTFTLTTNDYGFELTAPLGYGLIEALTNDCFTRESADRYLNSALNWNDIEKKEFRNIAETAGLVITGPPQLKKSIRYLQASSNLFFEVFKKYEPEHFLLRQAKAQALINFLESRRLSKVLDFIETNGIRKTNIKSLTPLAFPLYVARITNRASNENITTRIARLLKQTLKSNGYDSNSNETGISKKTDLKDEEIDPALKKKENNKEIIIYE